EDSEGGLCKVKLSEPIPPHEGAVVGMRKNVLHQLKPYPSKINMGDHQYLGWTGSIKTDLPFPVADYEFKFNCGTQIEYINSTALTVDGPQARIGPVELDSLSDDPVFIRFLGDYPLPVVRQLTRDIWVSHHGGSLSIQERYELSNGGAVLAEPFSRLQFMISAQSQFPLNAMNSFDLALEPGVRGAYFVDDIGNVSTSNLHLEKDKSLWSIRPRYPLFGSWNYTFTIGWDSDLSNYLRVPYKAHHILQVPLIQGPDSFTYDNVSVNIFLPEGATDIKLSSPLPPLSEERFNHFWFLDSTGRPSISLTFSGLTDDDTQRLIYVEYDYTSIALMQKPLMIFSVLMFLFAIAYGIKIDI
ncbi:hypothetical protein CANCADRAFT_18738, partial [Tortispora caseinolytica NRRL Y-17796]